MKNISRAFVLTAFAVCACTKGGEPVPTVPQRQDAAVSKVPESVVPGSVYVEVSASMAEKMEAGEPGLVVPGIGMKSCKRIFPDNPEFSKRYREAGLDRWYVIEYDDSVPTTKAAADISTIDGVETVSYPHKVRRCSTSFPFNDPESIRQWGLSSDGRLNEQLGTTDFKEGCDINVVPVWEQYTTGLEDVIVAVMDGGVSPDHEDLARIVVPFGAGGSKDFVTDSYVPVPDDHGTHVAGIIGAVNNNGKGISGIAGGSNGAGGVRIMSCTFVDGDEWCDESSMCRAYVWAAENGAVISNNSWGYVYGSEDEARDEAQVFNSRNNPLKLAMNYFLDYAGLDADGNQVGPVAGGTIVFAAGNDGWAYSVPSCYERVIAVGACGPSYLFTTYSNYGEWVDIVAPGGDVSGRYPYQTSYREIYSTCAKNNGYKYLSGTSQAAPCVSGVAALLASYFGGPGFTADMLRERLILGARNNVISGRVSRPMLDAYGAFKFVPSGSVSISTEYSGDYTIKSHENFSIEYKIDGNMSKRLPVTVESTCPSLAYEAAYDKVAISVIGLVVEPGRYPVRVIVGKGTNEEVSVSFTLTILENHAPEVKTRMENMILSINSSTLQLQEPFVDPDLEVLSITVSSSNENVVKVDIKDGVARFSPNSYGTADVTFTAKDARGASASQTIKVLVRNTAKSYDLYPNPVKDYIYVRAGVKEVSVDVEVIGDFGRKVLSVTTSSSPFNPARIDLSALAPDRYLVRVKDSDGVEFEQSIIKL
ncbi:MAG: S8 family serine peptidase [Bacteroidales bacterium]|nr:S8 family serine peptidase [Bacteroidales bacterium]